MPNFEGIISGGLVFYGVDTGDADWPYLSGKIFNGNPVYGGRMVVGSHEGQEGSGEYLLDGMTILDGWGREFYYCSDPPYQSYRLWSAGANGLTFPPWYELDSLDKDELKVVTSWTKDDLSHLEK